MPDEIRGKDNELRKLKDRFDIIKEGGYSKVEYREIETKIGKLEKELNVWKKQKIHEYFAPTSGVNVQQIKQEVDNAFKGKRDKKKRLYSEEYVLEPVKKGGSFVAKIIDSHGIKTDQNTPLPTMMQSGKRRGNYDPNTNTIDIGNQVGVDATVAHEIGHFLEDNNSIIHDRCQDFYNQITQGGTKRLLKDDFPNEDYDANEYYIPVKDMPVYATKYMKGATELFSVGMEYLYKNPIKFSQDYPEYFNFIISLIKKVSTL
jgi:hypothetical protein